MTPANAKALDKLFQKRLIARNPRSILLGDTEVIHHFKHKGGSPLSLRWYVPNGIPLTNEQHNLIHGAKGNEMMSQIYRIKGTIWRQSLISQAQRSCQSHELDFKTVRAHIEGHRDNYL